MPVMQDEPCDELGRLRTLRRGGDASDLERAEYANFDRR